MRRGEAEENWVGRWAWLGYTQSPATSVTPMDATLPIILPVFGLILLGYAMGKTPLITKAGVTGINNFVFYCAIPAFLFRTMSKLENLENADPIIFLAYYLPVFRRCQSKMSGLENASASRCFRQPVAATQPLQLSGHF